MTVAAIQAFTCLNLWNEIHAGPYAAILATHVTNGDDQGIANILNDKAGTATGPVNHADMQASDVAAQVDYAEFATLLANQVSTWQSIIQAQVVKIGSVNIQGFIDSTFSVANAPNSRRNLQALYTQIGSRSEVLFGTGVSVNAQQVSIARTTTGTGTF